MKNINITLLLGLCFNLLQAQNPLTKQWDQRFGGTKEDFLYTFQQTSDGGYILGGESASDSSGNKTQASYGSYDYWIVKIDSSGNKQWDKSFGGAEEDILYSLQQTKDGGYILGGTSNSGISGDKTQPDWDTLNFSHDFWVVKIDSLGNYQWDRDFGGSKNDYIFSLQQTIDGGYILGGSSYSDSSGNKTMNSYGNYDYWIVKVDSLGNYQWDKDFGGADDDELNAIKQTKDGGYILGGVSNSAVSGNKTQSSYGNYDYWVVKTDSLGNAQWQKDYGGAEDDILYSLLVSNDGGYVLAGTSISGISGNKTKPNWDTTNTTPDYWMVKIDSLGGIQWDKDFGGTDIEEQLGTVAQTLDGGYLLAGTSYSNISGDKTEANLGREQTWIVKTDVNGTKQWDKTIFTDAEDESGYAIQTRDGCYLIANYTSSDSAGYVSQQGWGFDDYWTVKFCDTTLLTTDIHSYVPFTNQLSVYPNPCTSEITISVKKQNSAFVFFVIYNVLGQPVFSAEENEPGNTLTKGIYMQDLSSGIYFLCVTADGKRMMKKIVKE